LYHFVLQSWNILESVEYSDNWHIKFICDHLEAMVDGKLPNLIVNVPPGTSKPVSVDGLVIEKSRGLIKLKEVIVGDQVLTHRGRFRTVSAVHEQGVLPLMELSTIRGRKLKLERSHPILTTRGWLQAKDVTLFDFLAEVRKPMQEPCGTATISNAEARLLGYLIGDGGLSGRQTVFTNQDAESISDFVHCADSAGFKTAVKTKQGKTCIISRVNVSSKKTQITACKNHPEKRGTWISGYCTSCRAKMKIPHNYGRDQVQNWKKFHGLYDSNSYTKTVPESIMRGSDENIIEFLAAYWACDGTISDRRDLPRSGRVGQKITAVRICCDTVSRGLAIGLHNLLNRLGLSFTLRKKIAKLRSKKQGELYTSWNVGSDSQDTSAKFMQIIGPRIMHAKRLRAPGLSRTDFEKVLVPDRVVEISEAEPGECRCLAVEEDSSFCYEGVAVHNSILCSVMLPAWTWTTRPTRRFLCASYSAELAIRDSIRTREILESAWYKARWPETVIKEDLNQKIKFENVKGGWRIATTPRGRGLGEHPDFLISDDAHNVREVESEAERNIVLNWWDQTMGTRGIARGASRLIVMQRLGEQDLSGHVLRQGGYEHVMLPMNYEADRKCVTSIGEDPRTEEGELLWPSLLPESKLALVRLRLGPRGVAGQFQQRPAPKEGALFKEDDFRYFREDVTDAVVKPEMKDEIVHEGRRWPRPAPAPEPEKKERVKCFVLEHVNGEGELVTRKFLEKDCSTFMVADTAQTVGVGADWTVVGTFSITPEHDLLIRHIWRDKIEIPMLYAALDNQRRRAGNDLVFMAVENKGSGMGVLQTAAADGRPMRSLEPGRWNKEVRASQASMLYNSKKVWHLAGARWLVDLESELLTFPNGQHDDICDVVSYAGVLCSSDEILRIRTGHDLFLWPQAQDVEKPKAVEMAGGIRVLLDIDDEDTKPWWKK
jgi:predicted phage terminase large subunit-like protein